MNKKSRRRTIFGPAILVTAAFIGPGTVLTASIAGSEYGYQLIWAVAFSVLATIVLQEMAARLGIISGDGLSQAIKKSLANPVLRTLVLGLVLIAIFIGNAAYQTGNIIGAASGVMSLKVDANQIKVNSNDSNNSELNGESSGNVPPESTGIRIVNEPEVGSEPSSLLYEMVFSQSGVVVVIGLFALVVIWIGRFEVLQTVLTLLVAAMSLMFLIAAIRSGPVWSEVASGLIPRIPQGGEWIIVGLIGTTVVPYNLFLHASAAAQRWKDDSGKPSDEWLASAIRSSRWDTTLSVIGGGLVTSAILITSAVAFHVDGVAHTSLSNVADVAIQLQPALGSSAKTMFAIGLFAAGLTSAITAPVAAGYAAAGCFGWPGKLSDIRLKITATLVVLFGVGFAIWLGKSPQQTIILAQVANGLLLPIIASLLLIMANRTDVMKRFKNRTLSNCLAIIIILIVTVIGYRKLSTGWEKFRELIHPVSSATLDDDSHPVVQAPMDPLPVDNIEYDATFSNWMRQRIGSRDSFDLSRSRE